MGAGKLKTAYFAVKNRFQLRHMNVQKYKKHDRLDCFNAHYV